MSLMGVLNSTLGQRNVSQECRMHSWEAKEAESVTEEKTGSLHGIDIVNGEAR